MRYLLRALPILPFSAAAMAVPPPPPPPEMVDIATKITDTLKPETFDEYASLFADDVKVYDNGDLQANDKAEWLPIAKKMAASWNITLRDSATSWNGVLIADTVSNMLPFNPNVVSDCCFWARSALYKFNDAHRINEVRFLESGGYWGTPEHPH